MNKKLISSYIIISLIAFSFLAVNSRRFFKTPLIQNLIKKTGALSKSLKKYSFVIKGDLSSAKYDSLALIIQSLPGIQSLSINKESNQVNCTFDSRKINNKLILEAITVEGFRIKKALTTEEKALLAEKETLRKIEETLEKENSI
ncbi:MAG: hypothetical protein GY730_00045 [bacterium]|nr:hypothetical protein [bacterium]